MISSMSRLRLISIVLAIPVSQNSSFAQAPPAPSGPAQGSTANSTSGPLPVAVPDSYVIGPDDILFIRVWRDSDYTGSYLVSPDGKIVLPLIRELQAAGLTREQLARQLTEAISTKLVAPDVTVQLVQVNSKKYYITGEVNRQGPFPLTAPITVFDALNGAGGFKEFARKGKIVIARGEKRINFNYEEVLKGRKLAQNILLQNGDTIIVP